MKFITRALVALDLSEMDDQLIHYSRLLSEMLHLEKIYFVHVIPDFFFPNQSEMALAGDAPVSAPIDELVTANIRKKVDEAFRNNPNKVEVSIEVLEGSPYNKILNWVNLKQIDLLITGRKKRSEGSGLTAKRVAHRANCHVLFVPENADLAPTRIMVPMDFSKNSVNALRMALNFKKILPETVIEAVNSVRYLPSDYYTRLDTNPVYQKAFRRERRKEYDKMVEKYDLPKEEIEMVFLESTDRNAARHLNYYADEDSFDLIIMGAQGHSAFQVFLYGSVTERFVDLCEDTPIFVVR